MIAWKCRSTLGIAATLATSVVLADATLEMEVTAGQKMQQLIQVSEGRVRVTTGVQGRDLVMLFREGVDQYQVLDGNAKTVMTISPQQVKQTMQQASGMMQQMQAMMAEQMKNMTPEQRAQVEQMMGKPTGGGARAKPQVRMTKRTEKVGSWSCEIIEVVEGGKTTGELCVASPKALGIAERDFQTMKAFFKMMRGMADSARDGMGGDMPFLGPEEMPGVPVRAAYLHRGKKGNVQLTKISTNRIPGNLFTVPDDYQPAQLPGMPMR